ncbi:hypothetical protein SAMN03080615_01669 [Amphritea atlantica]|uniref:Phage tail tube protein n=1 Tax=Amphritea atlantica TaxID=355243 RepID=A0A1H9GGM4_9GAMM|nr:phage tail tube protein [Amphritea atlantica]SEQ49216.1 hypothetical protein SAMN03080615_01669 [Amphritea atlantica]
MANKNISIPAQGLVFEIESLTTPDTWLPIGGIKTINRGEVAPGVNDESVLTSTYKEKSISLPDAGQFSGTLQYNRADVGQAEMHTAKATGVEANFRQVLSSGDVEAFSGYVLNMPFTANIGQSLEGQFSVEINGEPGWS